MNTDNKTVSDKTADWLLFSTIKPSDNEEIMYWMGGVKTGHYNADKNIVLELGKLPKYWLPIEHSKFTPKEQTKGVIEGLEDAVQSYCFNNPDANNNIGENSFKGGAEWLHDTHYMPLLDLCRELYSCYLMNQYREAHNLGLSDARRDEIMNANPTIIKAKQLLKQ